MKRIHTLLFLLICGLTAQAQFKPTTGDRNLQVSFAPLGGSPISITGITGRMFSSEATAYRGTIFLGFESNSTVTQDENNDFDQEELSDKNSSFSISIAPGIEQHMMGTERLSPYTGAFLNLGFTSTTEKEESQDGNDIITMTTKGGSLNVGLNGVAGFDYYVAPNLFMGVEMGLGLAVTSPFTDKITSDADGFEDVESREGNTSSLQFGPNVFGQIRLGWLLK